MSIGYYQNIWHDWWLALPISKKSPCKKFLGERLRALTGTLGCAALLAAGVNTLRSFGEF
jgi:hypothetical protein